MLSYDDVKNNPEVFQAMTSITVEEFLLLLPFFRETLIECLGGSWDPDRPKGRGRPVILETAENCFFFILFYFKNYPLQQVTGFLSGMDQATADGYIHALTEVLRKTFEKKGYTPERNPEKLSEYIKDEKQGVSIDGTQRNIQRPQDDKKQKKHYSGKKKTHTKTNIIIAGNSGRRVKFLSGTYPGPVSEIKTAAGRAGEEAVCYPEETEIHQDKGFQGYQPEGATVYQPKKKPPEGELTEEEKKSNSLISSVRIVVEHVISGVKRVHIVKDVFRNTKEGFDDTVMEIACALHNFRTDCRLTSY
jgi:hypothetical protein